MAGKTAKECCSVFEYFYRDGGNFKTYGRLLLTGCAADAEQAIRGCLEWGNQFVVEQVGVPSLCREHWQAAEDGPSDLDHAYHEFVSVRPSTTGDDDLKVWGSLDELLGRMRAAAGKWDVSLSPNCDL